jgi:TRAP-type uncharacterized transport system substrate-binding protein
MKPIAALRHALHSAHDLTVSAVLAAVLALVLLVLAYFWLDPEPPRHVTLATGPARSAYDEFGQRYRRALKPYGIDVVLVPTEGSSDNLALLREGKADLAFVQGGSGEHAVAADDSGIVSLGSLFLEPVWLFYREDVYKDEIARQMPARTLSSLTQMQGLNINVGTVGSGVPFLMRKLFEANHIDATKLALSELAETPGTMSFLTGDVDAVVFASAPESAMVQMLLATPGVKLMDFSQSEAYSRRLPFLTPVVLPRGVVDLAADQPPADIHLVATTTSMLARAGTHPALLQLFAQAAHDIHGEAGWFNRAGAYPSAERSEYPMAREAERAIRFGQPFLQRWMPFWMANLVERMWLVVGLLVAVMLPVSRIVPPLYQFRIRSRVFRWYRQLRDIENRLKANTGDVAGLVRELDALDERVARISVPLSYADELYELRNNIARVRRRATEHGMPASALFALEDADDART